MKVLKYIKNCRLFMVMAFCLMAISAFAQEVKVTMSDITINPGETQEVTISVTNTTAVGSSWQGDIYLPKGLSPVEVDGAYLAQNRNRTTTSHGLSTATKKENPSLAEGQIRFSLLSASGKNLKANEGVVLSFVVKADAALEASTVIELKDSKIDGTYNAACKAKVTNPDAIVEDPDLVIYAENVEAKAGETAILDFYYKSNIEMNGLQAAVVLPAGVTPVINEDDEFATFNFDRLTNKHIVSTNYDAKNNTVNVLTYADGKNIKGEDGLMFSITVQLADDLSGDYNVAINETYASTSAGKKYDVYAKPFTLSVTPNAVPTGAVSAQDMSLKANEEAVIDFNFATRSAFNGFQASVTLPEGITPIQDADEEWATFNYDRLSAAHVISSNYNAETNTVSILTYSDGQNLKGEEGVIFSIKVKVAEDIIGGAKKVQIFDAYAATSKGKLYTIPASSAVLNVTNIHTLTFDAAGGTEVEPIVAEYTTDVTAPVTTKVGHTFKGWDPAVPATMPYVDMQFKAQWIANEYTIIFDTDGGSEIDPITAYYGSEVTIPEDPTKEGYTFAGWDQEIPATIPAEGMTIKALWTINSYTLAFVVDGKTIKETSVVYGSEIEPLADLEKEGYTFSGWSEMPETMPAHDLTVYGSFTVNEYNLIYMVDDEIYAEYVVEYGTEITPEAAPEKYGYKFSGWSEIPATMPAHDVTVIGSFNRVLGDVNFDGKVNTIDIIIVTDLLLGIESTKASLTDEMLDAADIDCDGRYTVNDFTQITNIYVYGNKNGKYGINKVAAYCDANLSMNIAGNDVNLVLNSNQAIAAIQMDITMPEGINVDEAIYCGENNNAVVASNVLSDGTYRLFIYSADCSQLNAEEALASIKLNAAGKGEIEINNIMASTTFGELVDFAAIAGSFETTGINGAEIGQDGSSIYSLNGVRNASLKKGVNIVKTADGKVVKVLEK